MDLDRASDGRQSITVRMALTDELDPAFFLSIMRHRYQMYRGKDLISGGGVIELHETLRRALEIAGIANSDRVVPGDHGLDCDAHDFRPTCRHLFATLGDRLLSYLRILTESEQVPIPAREIYGGEIAVIAEGSDAAPVAEVSRYVLPGGFAGTQGSEARAKVVEMHRRLGLRMFKVVDRIAARQGVRHLFAQVHPIHGAYYVSQGIFEKRGDEKACPGVNNAPAVLMYRRVEA